MGPEIRFDRDAVVAVCGAHMPPKVDGVEQPDWTSFAVKSGQTLSFGFLKSGARAYIAVAGGVDVPVVLGSRSTYPLGALGGFEGRALKAATREVGAQPRAAKAGRSVPAKLRLEVRGTPRTARASRPLLASADRRGGQDLLRGRLEGCARGRSHRISLPRRPRALLRRRGNSHSARAPTRPTSSTAAIPTDRSRFPEARSPSSFTATRCRAADISCSEPSSRPTWT